MPLDGLHIAAKPTHFARGLEGLTNLANLLEAEELWRNTRMEWDFQHVRSATAHHCGSAGCAMGLMLVAWPEIRRTYGYEGDLGALAHVMGFKAAREMFGLTGIETDALFGWLLAETLSLEPHEVTPRHVIDAIRAFVARKET